MLSGGKGGGNFGSTPNPYYENEEDLLEYLDEITTQLEDISGNPAMTDTEITYLDNLMGHIQDATTILSSADGEMVTTAEKSYLDTLMGNIADSSTILTSIDGELVTVSEHTQLSNQHSNWTSMFGSVPGITWDDTKLVPLNIDQMQYLMNYLVSSSTSITTNTSDIATLNNAKNKIYIYDNSATLELTNSQTVSWTGLNPMDYRFQMLYSGSQVTLQSNNRLDIAGAGSNNILSFQSTGPVFLGKVSTDGTAAITDANQLTTKTYVDNAVTTGVSSISFPNRLHTTSNSMNLAFQDSSGSLVMYGTSIASDARFGLIPTSTGVIAQFPSQFQLIGQTSSTGFAIDDSGQNITFTGSLFAGHAIGSNSTQIVNKGYVDSAITTATSSIVGGFSNIYFDNTPGSRTWTCPAGITKARVTIVGGGCSGGGAGAGGSSIQVCTGGSSGAKGIKTWSTFVPGNTYAYTVGTGGIGDSSGSQNQGTSTQFTGPSGLTITASGGSGPNTTAGCLNCDINGFSNQGERSALVQNNTWYLPGGAGGPSPLGLGGAQGRQTTDGNANGAPGHYGGGGGGAVVNPGNGAQNGGNGGDGVVMIEY